MARTRVIVEKRFTERRAEMERAIQRGLGRGAFLIAAAAREQLTKYRIQSILEKIRAAGVSRIPGGFRATVVGADFREIFFEKGTYKRRRAKLKQGRRSSSQQRGVKAGHFLLRGLRAASPAVREEIRKEIDQIR